MFRNFYFTSRSTANLVTVIANRIARVPKTSGATQIAVLNLSTVYYRVVHSGLLYKFRYITL